MRARRATAELEVGVGEDPVMKHVGVRQLKQTDGGNLGRDVSRRAPGTGHQHRVQMCELGSYSSFTHHQATSGEPRIFRGEGEK